MYTVIFIARIIIWNWREWRELLCKQRIKHPLSNADTYNPTHTWVNESGGIHILGERLNPCSWSVMFVLALLYFSVSQVREVIVQEGVLQACHCYTIEENQNSCQGFIIHNFIYLFWRLEQNIIEWNGMWNEMKWESFYDIGSHGPLNSFFCF